MSKKIFSLIATLLLVLSFQNVFASQNCADWFVLNYVYEPSPNSIVINYTVLSTPPNPSQAPSLNYCRDNINYDGLLSSENTSYFDFSVGTHSITYPVNQEPIGNYGFEYDAAPSSQCSSNNVSPRPSVWQISLYPLDDSQLIVCNFNMPFGPPSPPPSFGFTTAIAPAPADFYASMTSFISANGLVILGCALIFPLVIFLSRFLKRFFKAR